MANSGYAKFATLIGQYPEYTIFRKFGVLGARRLLCLQAEIAHLENQLRLLSEIDQEDQQKATACTWLELRNLCDGDVESQNDKAREIFAKLDEYYPLLLQLQQVLNFPKCKESEISFLRKWLHWEKGGNYFLTGVEKNIYESEGANDLVSLYCNAATDSFAQNIGDKIRPIYHKILGLRFKSRISDEESIGPLWDYSHTGFVLLADLICAILSAAIPVGSIVLLYCVQNNLKRLIIITVMSFVFSFFLFTIVRGRRTDMFAASMAFAAVQVVFVSGVSFVSKH